MAYTKTNWLARTGTGLGKYKDTNDNNRVLNLVHNPDTITQNGTPFSAENMNKIEGGIYNAHVTADGAVQKNGGELKDTVTTFLDAASRANIVTGEKTSTIFGKIKKWFSDLGSLAFKSKTAAGDYTAGSIANADISATAAIAYSKLSGVAATSHSHGGVTNDGKIGTVANKLVYTGSGGALNADTVANLKALFLDITHPVGSIFMSASLNSASAVALALGGTWVAWGAGRVPVGVDTTQSEFDAVEEMGGSKASVLPQHNHSYNAPPSATGGHTLSIDEMPSHTHRPSGTTGSNHDNSNKIVMNTDAPTTEVISDWNVSFTGGNQPHSHDITPTQTTTGNAGVASTLNTNLQPYITCYMYKRTA